MNTAFILKTILLIISMLLITLILLQSKGIGLSGFLTTSSLGFYRSRRGIEKFVFILTILLAVSFIVLSLLTLIVS